MSPKNLPYRAAPLTDASLLVRINEGWWPRLLLGRMLFVVTALMIAAVFPFMMIVTHTYLISGRILLALTVLVFIFFVGLALMPMSLMKVTTRLASFTGCLFAIGVMVVAHDYHEQEMRQWYQANCLNNPICEEKLREIVAELVQYDENAAMNLGLVLARLRLEMPMR